jgi:hypothetical protein
MPNDQMLRRWRRIDLPGLELMTLSRNGSGLCIRSTVIHAGAESFALRYCWKLDASWRTRSLCIDRTDAIEKSLLIERTGDTSWRVDGADRPDLAGCHEVDVSATPFCNTLAIRHLGIEGRRTDGAVRRRPGAHLPAVTTTLRAARPARLALHRQRRSRRLHGKTGSRRRRPRRQVRAPVREAPDIGGGHSAALAIAALCRVAGAYLRSWVSDGTIFRASSIFVMSMSAMTTPAFSPPASASTSPQGATAIECP